MLRLVTLVAVVGVCRRAATANEFVFFLPMLPCRVTTTAWGNSELGVRQICAPVLAHESRGAWRGRRRGTPDRKIRRLLRSFFKTVQFASKWPSSTTNIILLNLSFTVLRAHRTGFLKRCCEPFADVILGNGIVSKRGQIFRRNSISSKWRRNVRDQ